MLGQQERPHKANNDLNFITWNSGEAKIEYEQTVTKKTMSWTGKQRERLTVEKNILDKYFQSCIECFFTK